ncbi:MAG: cobalamin biosynthesis protein [Alphaproteobacteria bacterium]|nr:cobalamin biosynthesis protein [Alphaproteobacteria bacterium]
MSSFAESFQTLHSQIFDPDRLPIAIAAVLIILFVGMFRAPFGGNTAPIFWHLIDKLFGNLGDRMDKKDRLKGDLIFRGLLLTLMVTSMGFLFGRFFDTAVPTLPYSDVYEVFVLCLCMASGTSVFALARLYKALNNKNVDEDAYYRIARSTRTNLSKSDDYTITRVGMGMLARNFDKGVVSPVLWYLIFGLSGAFLYTGLAGLAWRFGKDGKSSGFGQSALGLERLLGAIPNFMAGLFMAFAATFTPTASTSRAVKGWLASKGRAKYEEGGGPLTSGAWALNASLGGPTQDVNGDSIQRGWVGPERASAQLDAV